MTLAVRIWLADEPGRLGVVASDLGTAGVNVVGMEVLERSAGLVIDELRVEAPAAIGADGVARRLAALPGVRVDDVRALPSGAEERGLEVIRAAEALLDAANATAAVSTLMAMARQLFDYDWSALVDLRSRRCLERSGDVPSTEWLFAFVGGAASAPGGAETAASGVIAGSLSDSGLVLCVGRGVGFRRRERRELDMLARVADRMCRPIRGDRIPLVWAQPSLAAINLYVNVNGYAACVAEQQGSGPPTEVVDPPSGSEPSLRIGDAAARAGVSARTLRYYEELGLLRPSGHTAGGERRYQAADLVQLERILELRDVLGMNLEEIRAFLNSENRLAEVREAYRAKRHVATTTARAQQRALLEEALTLNEALAEQLNAKLARMDAFRAKLVGNAERCRELLAELE